MISAPYRIARESGRASGFTLVELSIVLVVIGLLVGGVLAGKDLIEVGGQRAFITEIQDYQANIALFRQKYKSWPGDMHDAFANFGSQCGTNTLVPTGCNGNGNGQIDAWTESWRAWQHLSFAGLAPTGLSGTASGITTLVGVNIPRSKWAANTGYYLSYGTSLTGYAPTSNHLILGGERPNDFNNMGAIAPEDAQRIDAKIDDGAAASGMVIGSPSFSPAGCTTGAVGSQQYTLTDKQKSCLLVFKLPS